MRMDTDDPDAPRPNFGPVDPYVWIGVSPFVAYAVLFIFAGSLPICLGILVAGALLVLFDSWVNRPDGRRATAAAARDFGAPPAAPRDRLMAPRAEQSMPRRPMPPTTNRPVVTGRAAPRPQQGAPWPPPSAPPGAPATPPPGQPRQQPGFPGGQRPMGRPAERPGGMGMAR